MGWEDAYPEDKSDTLLLESDPLALPQKSLPDMDICDPLYNNILSGTGH